MANALRVMPGGKNCYSSTIEFLNEFNDAFDALSVQHHGEGARARDLFKQPYTCIDDFRFKVSILIEPRKQYTYKCEMNQPLVVTLVCIYKRA